MSSLAANVRTLSRHVNVQVSANARRNKKELESREAIRIGGVKVLS